MIHSIYPINCIFWKNKTKNRENYEKKGKKERIMNKTTMICCSISVHVKLLRVLWFDTTTKTSIKTGNILSHS